MPRARPGARTLHNNRSIILEILGGGVHRAGIVWFPTLDSSAATSIFLIPTTYLCQ
jgi:hypothetical protein